MSHTKSIPLETTSAAQCAQSDPNQTATGDLLELLDLSSIHREPGQAFPVATATDQFDPVLSSTLLRAVDLVVGELIEDAPDRLAEIELIELVEHGLHLRLRSEQINHSAVESGTDITFRSSDSGQCAGRCILTHTAEELQAGVTINAVVTVDYSFPDYCDDESDGSGTIDITFTRTAQQAEALAQQATASAWVQLLDESASRLRMQMSYCQRTLSSSEARLEVLSALRQLQNEAHKAIGELECTAGGMPAPAQPACLIAAATTTAQ